MRLCSEKILLLVTNYDLLGIAAIIRKSVFGHFKFLCPVFAESNLECCILVMIIKLPIEFISYKVRSSENRRNTQAGISESALQLLCEIIMYGFQK